jgi:hypothetical protein
LTRPEYRPFLNVILGRLAALTQISDGRTIASFQHDRTEKSVGHSKMERQIGLDRTGINS